MPICRVESELAAYQKTVDESFNEVFSEDTNQPVRSIFAGSDVVDEPDECRIEARRQNMSSWTRRQNEINSEKGRMKAEREIAKKIEAAK